MTAIVVLSAFVLGVATGWATGYIPELVRADPTPTPSPTATPGLDPSIEPVLPPMSPITREITDADRAAGVTTMDLELKGAGTFSVVPGVENPVDGMGEVRYVSVSVEDGITANPTAFRTFVLNTLNSAKGWGADNTYQYVATDGVADYRIVLASPYAAAALCPDPHAVSGGPVTEESESAQPSPSAQASDAPVVDSPWRCGEDGVIVLSSYDWTAGYLSFGKDVTAARQYILNHRIGHLMGLEEATCAGGVADVMVPQEDALPDGCESNPWPHPDAVEPGDSPSETPTPSTAGTA